MTATVNRMSDNYPVTPEDQSPADTTYAGAGWRECAARPVATAVGWLERIDPGTHRRIKGLRLVTAYGIAAMLGSLQAISHDVPDRLSLSSLAGGFALWASVSEARTNRTDSSRDLCLLCSAAVLGATMMISLTPVLSGQGRPGPELTLAVGAFLVGYLKRFGTFGAGIGSQIYIGQLLAYGARLRPADLWTVVVAGLIATLAAIVPRVLSGPAEKPVPVSVPLPVACRRGLSPALIMGLQGATAAIVIVVLNKVFGLEQSAWAITACTYVIAGSTAGTIDRVRRRIVGTLIGVPLGIACLPVAMHAPLLIWVAAAIAMVIYAMALPERYDIACAAFAFALVVTLAVNGVHSTLILSARIWETLIGAAFGLAAAMLVFPLRAARSAD
jgi:Fusaric acid resistance protein-like